jgi:flagellar hook protein FlgE
MDIGSTGSALYSGLSGIQAGQRRVDQAASEIASSAVDRSSDAVPANQPQRAGNVDPSESLVALNLAKVETQASAKVVETADEVLGTLIDTRA